MRVQFASDLHLEFLARQAPEARLVVPAPEADLLVLAGDIHNGVQGVRAFADWPVPVLYVAGNHEFYEHDWAATRQALRAACAGTRVSLLDEDAVVIEGIRILGCTLWTDFALLGDGTQAEAMAAAERGMMDYHVIGTDTGPLRAAQTLADHQRSRAWLQAELARPFDGPTLVVTHHGPHALSIHPRFAANRLNPGYVSDLSPLLVQADLWLHGHTHDSFDYRVGRCRVMANPAGYLLNRAPAVSEADFRFENACFDPGRFVDLRG